MRPHRRPRARPTRALALAAALAAACVRHPAARPPTPADTRGEALVNVGYGTRHAGAVTGSIASVSGGTIAAAHALRMEDLLRSRVAGLEVRSRPDGTLSLRIRGATSFLGSSEPLVVVDGTPAFAGPGVLAAIAPTDVARIDVLKDASATAIYGLRGANGVILVTTRRR